MGLFGGILGAVGNFVLPGIGGVIGGAVGSAIDGNRQQGQADNRTNEMNAFNAQQSAEAFERQAQFNHAEAEQTRNFNEQEAGRNREFQKDMRATQYQTAVADMERAGLNPMLAYSQGGAGTPSGSQATSSAASASSTPAHSADKTVALQLALSSAKTAQDIQESNSRIGVNNADIALKAAQAEAATSSAKNLDMSTKEIEWRTNNVLPEQMHLLRSQTGTEIWKQTVAAAEAELKKVQANLTTQNVDVATAQAAYLRIKTLLDNLATPQARNAANAEDTWWKRNITPFIGDVAKTVGIGANLAH